jgi:hypothetical protein
LLLRRLNDADWLETALIYFEQLIVTHIIKNFSPFTNPTGLLDPVAGCPILKIHFNIILLCISRSESQ